MPSESSPSYVCNNITGSQSLYNGSYTVSAEKIKTNSTLVNVSVSKLKVSCRKTGNPSGSITIGVFDSSGNVLHTFGTVNTAQINVTNIWLTGESTTGYTLSAGESFGVKYTGGNSTNYVTVNHVDVNPPFDGTLAHWVRNNGSNQDFTAIDLSFELFKYIAPVNQEVKIEFYPTGNVNVNQELKIEFYPTGNTQNASSGTVNQELKIEFYPTGNEQTAGSATTSSWNWWIGMRGKRRYGNKGIRRIRL